MSRSKPITAAEYTYTVLLQPEPEGGFTVTCPTLPGLVTYGETIEEARAMVAEAIECYLESLQKDGLPIPESDAGAAPRAEPISVKLAIV
jgi:antitoxin HicB